MDRFRRLAEGVAGENLVDSAALHRWSVQRPEQFWGLLFDEMLPGVARTGPAMVDPGPVPHPARTRWFPEVSMNVAEVILTGRLDAEGDTFESEEMSAKCPSKYEDEAKVAGGAPSTPRKD